ncbi:DUF1963 domain-containing protein [Citricoccus sp. SGAir0253]|uniref:DUF1963 domain-containing protein n=1 Tax=Citricoccus sp. SGAir0253 TaxID=2567881 RepID=UPI0010CCBEB8|nr:DUF1963 domain-containing protein [Citricoccus sp. SGAir0253]QCU79175.1 DUF1963 domain-containing protein [Citricoccus sp. SGAir0253]
MVLPLGSFPPIHGTYPAILDWLDAHGGGQWQDRLRYALAFSEQGFDPGEQELADAWPSGAQVSWLGGPAVDTGAWPHDADGVPLTHVATIDLAGLDGALDRAGKAIWPTAQLQEGLPRAGILQVFHDLRTYGHEPGDRERKAWVVIVSGDPAYPTGGPTPAPTGRRPALVDRPGAWAAPTRACQLVLPFSGFALPSPLDLSPREAGEFDRLEELTETVHLAWMSQRGVGGSSAIPTTHAYGYSSRGHHAASMDLLPEALPLADGDRYRLILEIEGWTVLEGWFGDAGSLEVWMRQSDLDAGAFENTWCLVRTD